MPDETVLKLTPINIHLEVNWSCATVINEQTIELLKQGKQWFADNGIPVNERAFAMVIDASRVTGCAYFTPDSQKWYKLIDNED